MNWKLIHSHINWYYIINPEQLSPYKKVIILCIFNIFFSFYGGGVRRIISLPLPLPRICTCISWIALAYMMSAPCTFRVSKCFLCNKKPSIFILHLNISKVRYQLPILKYIYYKFVMHSVSIQYIHVHVSWVFDNQSRNIAF